MILKTSEVCSLSTDPRIRAGQEAERQMAFYLGRKFGGDNDVLVLNDIRLEDDAQVGACQIDHLVTHKHGVFIVESKSVSQSVEVRPDGSGGEMWERVHNRSRTGMQSPIAQAQRQAEFVRAYLNKQRESLSAKVIAIARPLARLMGRSQFRGYQDMPVHIIVAISDAGRFVPKNGWKTPTCDFAPVVCKADMVCEKIVAELDRHRKGASPLQGGPKNGQYGLWHMDHAELLRVAEYLRLMHKPRRSDTQEFARSEVPINEVTVVAQTSRTQTMPAQGAKPVTAAQPQRPGR